MVWTRRAYQRHPIAQRMVEARAMVEARLPSHLPTRAYQRHPIAQRMVDAHAYQRHPIAQRMVEAHQDNPRLGFPPPQQMHLPQRLAPVQLHTVQLGNLRHRGRGEAEV